MDGEESFAKESCSCDGGGKCSVFSGQDLKDRLNKLSTTVIRLFIAVLLITSILFVTVNPFILPTSVQLLNRQLSLLEFSSTTGHRSLFEGRCEDRTVPMIVEAKWLPDKSLDTEKMEENGKLRVGSGNRLPLEVKSAINSNTEAKSSHSLSSMIPIGRSSKSLLCLHAFEKYSVTLPQIAQEPSTVSSFKWRICGEVISRATHLFVLTSSDKCTIVSGVQDQDQHSSVQTAQSVDCTDEPTSRPTSMPTAKVNGKFPTDALQLEQ